MSETVKLQALDGNQLGAYVARPVEAPKAGLVVIQEIFGVNKAIRSVVDSYAADGFLAIAPAIFDRIEPNVELGYDGEDSKKAYALMAQLKHDTSLLDIAAAMAWLREHSLMSKVGVVGFCRGGLLSWMSATNLDPQAAVGYYPGGIGDVADQTPTCPVMLHFGEDDTHIPVSNAEKVHAAHPAVQVYLYAGVGHAFANEMRPSYDAEAAMLARERSLAFFKEHLF